MIISKIFWLVLLDVLHSSLTTDQAPHYEDTCTFEQPTLRCESELSHIRNSYDVAVLEFSNVSWSILNFEKVLEWYPNLEVVSIIGGNAVSVIPPERNNSIKVLELKKLLITNITNNFIQHFPKLKILDLSENKFKTFCNDFSLRSLEVLYLKNNPWKCSENLQWTLNLDRNIAKDLDNLTCYGMPYSGKPVLPIAIYLKELEETCLRNCICALERVAQDVMSDKLEPIISVNCSFQGLTDLPQYLPKYTRILHLEGNSIQNLAPLKTNRMYRGLWDLYLDYNQVTSIRSLEGSHWLSHFRAFSLKGNKLAKVPAYALDNALLRNPNMPIAVRLYLGENPWRCDCLFVPVFQELVLQKYARQIKDIQEVKCTYVEGDENSLLPIIEVSRSSVCRLPNEYSLQEGLDLLNIVLASLIIFIFGKLVYDCYHFKKTGRLPWIVTKMP